MPLHFSIYHYLAHKYHHLIECSIQHKSFVTLLSKAREVSAAFITHLEVETCCNDIALAQLL